MHRTPKPTRMHRKQQNPPECTENHKKHPNAPKTTETSRKHRKPQKQPRQIHFPTGQVGQATEPVLVGEIKIQLIIEQIIHYYLTAKITLKTLFFLSLNLQKVNYKTNHEPNVTPIISLFKKN